MGVILENQDARVEHRDVRCPYSTKCLLPHSAVPAWTLVCNSNSGKEICVSFLPKQVQRPENHRIRIEEHHTGCHASTKVDLVTLEVSTEKRRHLLHHNS